MGGNGSYNKKIGGVPTGQRTHRETGHTILGHKILLLEGESEQIRNIMNSNSKDPIYLVARKNEDGSLQVCYVNDFTDHKLCYEINLKSDSHGNVLEFNGKEQHSHAHEWYEGDDGNMHRKPVHGNTHLAIPKRYDVLIRQIESFNKRKEHCLK